MFGQNEIVGRRYFITGPRGKFEDGNLLITSIFFTLQGEGPYSGRPAVFVRLAKCNLACSFCDTFFDSGDKMSSSLIITRACEEVAKFYGIDIGVTHSVEAAEQIIKSMHIGLVITGGEPLLQDISSLVGMGSWVFDWVQVETNGTQLPVKPLPGITFVISPKCLEVDLVPNRYLHPREELLDLAHALKFVMCAPSESNPKNPYSEVPGFAHFWASKRDTRDVFISPMNIYKKMPAKAQRMVMPGEPIPTDLAIRSAEEVISFWEPGLLDMEANQRNHEYAARYAMRHGFRFQLQVHLFAGLA